MSIENPPIYEPAPRAIPAWAFSVVFHVILLVTIGWLTQPVTHGTTREVDRPIGIAVVERLPHRDQSVQPEVLDSLSESNSEPATESPSTSSPASLAPANLAPPVDLAGVIQEMTSGDVPTLSVEAADGVFGAGTDTSGDGARPKASGKPTSTMVFGVTGSGSRFIYVFDRSDSMNGFGGKPLRAAKKELKRSLESMTENQQFQVIFYNEDAKPFIPAGTPLSLLRGESTMVRRATQYVDAVKAFGGTEHFGALQMALRMGPDVIFFLTDARVPRLTASQLAEVRRLADLAGTSIHAIEFGAESAAPQESFLMQLAAENRGEYRYIAIDQLFADPSMPLSSESVTP